MSSPALVLSGSGGADLLYGDVDGRGALPACGSVGADDGSLPP